MAPDRPLLTLTVPSDLRFLGIVRGFVEAVCQTGEVDEPTTRAILLATGEAASNIIRHAHRDLPQAEFQIQCRLSPDALEINLLDEGEPFDLNAVPDLDPSEIRVGGRGVFLMRKLMDELTCERRGEHGNTLRMVKRLGRKSTTRHCG
jgi:serine/threonine-protein kinase RsbW